MPIGRLSRASLMSVRAQRLDGAEGLFVPAWVDPASGYRHYQPEQVRRHRAASVFAYPHPSAAIRVGDRPELADHPHAAHLIRVDFLFADAEGDGARRISSELLGEVPQVAGLG